MKRYIPTFESYVNESSMDSLDKYKSYFDDDLKIDLDGMAAKASKAIKSPVKALVVDGGEDGLAYDLVGLLDADAKTAGHTIKKVSSSKASFTKDGSSYETTILQLDGKYLLAIFVDDDSIPTVFMKKQDQKAIEDIYYEVEETM